MAVKLEEGSRVGVIGGGPAGSLTAYFLLTFAHRMNLGLEADSYPTSVTRAGTTRAPRFRAKICQPVVLTPVVSRLKGNASSDRS